MPAAALSLPAPFVHLHVHSAFSFGDGASSVEALVLRAAQTGQFALALTDTSSVTGIVRLAQRCLKAGIKPLGGCEIILEGGHRLTLLMDGPRGWSSLCRLLSAAALRDIKRRGARIRWEELEESRAGLVCLSGCMEYGEVPRLLRNRRYRDAADCARRHLALFGKGSYAIEVTRTLAEEERELSLRLFQLADHLGVPAIVTNPVHHATKMGAAAHEALCRVRLGLAPDQQHPELPGSGERYLKSAQQMAAPFADRPDALHNAVRLAERLAPPLDPEARHFPVFAHLPPGESAFSHLADLTWRGAQARYKDRMTAEVRSRLVHELETIRDLGYCDYFLVCWDVCREARRRQIGHSLRGSAVGSAVAYCLYMSSHDPVLAHKVSFERFLSKARRKPPDIDIDFRHDLRDEMMTYVRQAYGEDRVANVANYVTYRGRSLLRDMGKVLGLDAPDIDRLREMLWHSRGDDLMEKLAEQPELRSLGIDPERYSDLFALCAQLAGLPRHLGTHASGLVVSDVPLGGIVPLQWAAKGVTVAAPDKEDVEAPGIGLLKMDQLSLRALTAVDIAVDALREEDPAFDYAGRDREDEETLALIRAAETVGVFQLESAQMALQWRLQADRFDDLVASVALIRPGPLSGGSVDPYVRRRHGWEPVTYPLPELEPVLRETYGRILFQDQVLDVVRIVGGFTPDEADLWLKTMTHARDRKEMTRLGRELLERAKEKGLSGRRFSRLWKQIVGFSRYGFCEGHSLAFADHAQGTAWLLRHHPAEFLAAVLSVEPCGFWPVATVVAEAERRGVRVLGPCVNRSPAARWSVEQPSHSPSPTIRCALSRIKGLDAAAMAIEEERESRGEFPSLEDFCRRCSFLSREQVEWLTLAGALDALSPSRRRTLWSLPALHYARQQTFRGRKCVATGQGALEVSIAPPLAPQMADFCFAERFEREWQALGFSAEGHPMLYHRGSLNAVGALPCAALQQAALGTRVTIAGLVIRPHRPPTPSGKTIVFFTLEDESGLAQVTVMPDIYECVGQDIFGSMCLAVTGRAEKRGAGIILLAEETQSI